MTRQPKKGRTTQSKAERQVVDGIPPLRKRNPVMFWFIILAVVAMVLGSLGSFLSLFF